MALEIDAFLLRVGSLYDGLRLIHEAAGFVDKFNTNARCHSNTWCAWDTNTDSHGNSNAHTDAADAVTNTNTG